MLWACLHLPRLPIELREPRDVGVAAVTDQHGSRRYLIACNDTAQKAGLHHGMDATTALAYMPSVLLLKRSPVQEKRALNALASWALQFSSRVSMDAQRWLLWIEIGASLKYFDGLDALKQKIINGVESLSYSASLGIAPTPEAAALLAYGNSASCIEHRDAIQPAISALPIHCLSIATQVREHLHSVGLRNIGEVLDIPRDQLARRFGPEVTTYLQRLLGEAPDPRRPHVVATTYQRRFELAAAIYSVEALLFPLRRMLLELQGYLRSRDTALQLLHLRLNHEHTPATLLQIRTTAPQRDAQRLLMLLREKLERTALPEATTELVIKVDEFVSPGDTQMDFFAEAKSRDRSWTELLDKLRARLGEQAIKRLGLNDDHLPEKAWCVATDEARQQHADTASLPERPLWLIEPKLLHDLPQLPGKPERIECGWWHEDARRDYYIAETAEGARWWLYRDLDSAQWYLQGLWG